MTLHAMPASSIGDIGTGCATRSWQSSSMTDGAGADNERWYTIVQRLTQQDASDGDAVQSLLQHAVMAAQADDQWANSGMLELLCRARDSAASGFPATALKAATELLGFHSVVEKYRQAHPLDSAHGEGKRSSSTNAEGAEHPPSPDQDPEGNELQPNNPNDKGSASNSSSQPRTPKPKERKRRRSIAEHIEEASPNAAAGLHGEQPLGVWHGPISLQTAAGGEEFCSVAMQVPSTILEDLPPALQACSIKQRRGLQTKGQIACRTSITRAGPKQLAELYKMAQHELVAIMPVDDCAVILAPYLTEAVDPRSSLNFKVATFIAALCS